EVVDDRITPPLSVKSTGVPLVTGEQVLDGGSHVEVVGNAGIQANVDPDRDRGIHFVQVVGAEELKPDARRNAVGQLRAERQEEGELVDRVVLGVVSAVVTPVDSGDARMNDACGYAGAWPKRSRKLEELELTVERQECHGCLEVLACGKRRQGGIVIRTAVAERVGDEGIAHRQ